MFLLKYLALNQKQDVKADADGISFKNSIHTLSDGFDIPFASGWKEIVKLSSPRALFIKKMDKTKINTRMTL